MEINARDEAERREMILEVERLAEAGSHPGHLAKVARDALAMTVDPADRIIREAKADHRELTELEERRLESLKADKEKLETLIAGLAPEKERERQRMATSVAGNGSMLEAWRQANPNPAPQRAPDPRSYAGLFGTQRPASGRGDFESLYDFCSAIDRGWADDRLKAAAAGASESIGADGGYLTPTEFAATAIDGAMEAEIVRPWAFVVPMRSNGLTVPGVNDFDHTANISGFTGQWVAEGDTATVQKTKYYGVSLRLKKLFLLTAATNELLADSSLFNAIMPQKMSQAIAWWNDYYYLNGTGAGQPLGILKDPALVVVPKQTAQVAGTIYPQNLADMYARMHPAGVNSAVWIASQTTLPRLLMMMDPVENKAGSEYVGGHPARAIQQTANGGMTIYGRPLLLTEKVPTLGNQGDILFVDLSQYYIGLAPEMGIDMSKHLGFASDQSHFRIILRTDARGAWKSAFTPKNGNSLSWCVTLAVRS